ncbi:MAG: MCE family protein [Candidatus Omnitrophica bacterium]|nr:MCE family protein [Candidatus Omnitrophota bacterium]
MKRNKLSLELRVGIFVIVTIICIILFVATQATSSKYRGYEIGVLFDYVSGLETGSPVRVSGVRAGEVRQIEIMYDVQPKVLAKLRMRQDIKISSLSRITIQTFGIIGEKYIEITPSSDKKYIKPGEIVEGENPLTMEKLAAAGQSIIVQLNDVLTDIGELTGDEEIRGNLKSVLNESAAAITKIDKTFTQIGELTATLNQTSETMHKTISANAPKMELLLDNANELVYSGKIRMEETLHEIKKFASAGTTAAESFKDIQEAAVSFTELSREMQNFVFRLQNEGLFARMMKEEELLDNLKKELFTLHEATKQFKQTSETINDLSTNMNTIVSDMKDGQGTIGKFMRSDQLYRDIEAFVQDIKANPWKLLFRKRQ